MVSLYHFKNNSRASLAVMEDLEDLEEIGVYLEAASCINCQQLSSSNSLLEEKLRFNQSVNFAREQRLKFMEENALAWEEKSSEFEIQAEELKKERIQLQESIKELENKNAKLLKELETLRTSMDRTPELAPPPPPPPMPPKFRLHFWKPTTNGGLTKKSRSKSLSRVEDFKRKRNPNAPMVLNDAILDAIRNRRYSLRHVDDADERKKSMIRQRQNSDDNIAKIIQRQAKMVYSDDEDEDDDNPYPKNIRKSSQYSASLPRLPTILSLEESEEEETEEEEEEEESDDNDDQDGPKSVIFIGGSEDSDIIIHDGEISSSASTNDTSDDAKTPGKKFNSF